MKKLTLCAAAALTAAISTANAQEAPPYENWIGVFGQYYNADSDKVVPIGGLDDGKGFGLEAGFRFDPSWAIRFELGRVLIGHDSNNIRALDDDGTQIGADMMYFLEDDVAYLFAGLREQSLITENYRMASVGVGKHWEVAENWRVITEIAGYHDFGQNHHEYSAKLGLAYIFGTNKVAANPDSDNDGVYDAVDRCANTPMGTTVDATGCNIDMDGDGVQNAQDQCPGTLAGSKVDAMGCAIKDADNDGVADDQDMCANTAAGTKVNAKGCSVSLDTDNDGVLDSRDNCLDTPTTDKVDANGCSIFEKKEVSIAFDILFGNNSSIVSNPNDPSFGEFADFMNRYPNTQAVIEGHSSAVGDANYNQFISEKRAKAVRTLLIDKYSIDAGRLESIGYGESRLKDTSNTAAANRTNRRIEIKVTALVDEKVNR